MIAGIRFVLASIIAAAMLVATGAAADDMRVPHPVIAKGRGDQCVADTTFMRRNHMRVLKHQRDDTVHAGERTGKFSLKDCIACHAVDGGDAQPVDFDSPKHFCRACHDFAAVKVDCFSCHAARPGAKDTARFRQVDGDLTVQLREAVQ
jgi:hypothetical protein